MCSGATYPRRRRGGGTRSRTASTPAYALAAVVEFALSILVDLRNPHPLVTNGEVELRLRDAADHLHGELTRG